MTVTPHRAVFHSVRGYNEWTHLALFWLTLLLLFRIAALALNRTDLMFDEAQYWAWAQEPAWGYFSKPPLLAWVIASVTNLCGNSEFCVRLASPLLYWGAGLFIYLAGRTLHDAHTGFWAAIVFSTLPGVTFSAGVISTDVPLLFCWAAALFAWCQYLEVPDWRRAALLGAAIGLGLNAKYAMAYFFLCMAASVILVAEVRKDALRKQLLLALIVPAVLLLPNMLWNAANGFITFAHTADNANWNGFSLHADKAAKFVAEQFGVFGPVLFTLLIWIAIRTRTLNLPAADRMLLCFSLPVIILIIGQALMSRAHANWAAVAYPAASILVTACMLRLRLDRLFRVSLGLHVIAVMLIAVANWAAPALSGPRMSAIFQRTLGWSEMAETVRQESGKRAYRAIITDDRWITSELLYYLRDSNLPIRAWKAGTIPRDHFELTRAFTGNEKGPYLFVGRYPPGQHLSQYFQIVEPLPSARIPAGAGHERKIHFTFLDGYRGKQAVRP